MWLQGTPGNRYDGGDVGYAATALSVSHLPTERSCLDFESPVAARMRVPIENLSKALQRAGAACNHRQLPGDPVGGNVRIKLIHQEALAGRDHRVE